MLKANCGQDEKSPLIKSGGVPSDFCFVAISHFLNLPNPEYPLQSRHNCIYEPDQ
jgi:hypothetical protein